MDDITLDMACDAKIGLCVPMDGRMYLIVYFSQYLYTDPYHRVMFLLVWCLRLYIDDCPV